MTSRPSIVVMMIAMMLMMTGLTVEAFGGFTPQNQAKASLTSSSVSLASSPFMRLPAAKKTYAHQILMSNNGDDAQNDVQTEPAKPTGGDLYDDEVEPYVNPLSDSMRAKLMKEASSGLDSEVKSTNTIFYIGAAIAVLVILGGKGILY